MQKEKMSMYSRIRHVVKIKHTLKLWRAKDRVSSALHDVPAGHLVVCVGPARRRYVMRTAHLNHPLFQALLDRAEEECGFTTVGPLAIPNCDESTFEEILRVVSSRPASFSCCHVVGGLSGIIHGGDSLPLLRG